METLTTGKPGKVSLRFAIPIYLGYILQQVYQMVDNIIVGQFVGADAFAAVGFTYGFYFLVSFCVGNYCWLYSVDRTEIRGR